MKPSAELGGRGGVRVPGYRGPCIPELTSAHMSPPALGLFSG